MADPTASRSAIRGRAASALQPGHWALALVVLARVRRYRLAPSRSEPRLSHNQRGFRWSWQNRSGVGCSDPVVHRDRAGVACRPLPCARHLAAGVATSPWFCWWGWWVAWRGRDSGARRTQSAFPAFSPPRTLRTCGPDLDLGESLSGAATANLTGQLARLRYVEPSPALPRCCFPWDQTGPPPRHHEVSVVGSVGGEYFSQDRVTVAQGRMADPRSPDEMVATAEAAKLSGWHVGETVPFGAITVRRIEPASIRTRPSRRCAFRPSSSVSSCSRARSSTMTSTASRPMWS